MYLRFYTFRKEKKFSSLQIPKSHDLIFFPGPSLFASLRFGKKKYILHVSGSGFSWCLWGVGDMIGGKNRSNGKASIWPFKFMLKKIVLEKNKKESFVTLNSGIPGAPTSTQAASS